MPMSLYGVIQLNSESPRSFQPVVCSPTSRSALHASVELDSKVEAITWLLVGNMSASTKQMFRIFGFPSEKRSARASGHEIDTVQEISVVVLSRNVIASGICDCSACNRLESLQ